MALVLLALALLYVSSSVAVFLPRDSDKSRCESFNPHTYSGFTFTNTTYVEKGALNETDSADANNINSFPFCRLFGQISYGTNATLNFELWLPPSQDYKGRYLAVGNEGMAGTIDMVSMMLRLNEGFAVAGSDSGHLALLNNGGNGAPGVFLPYLHDTDQVLAWIHNSVAMFTPTAKDLIHSYFGRPPTYSYYVGCSTGGAQGFALAQFHPELFDGIVAGSPGNWYSHLALSFLWNAQKITVNGTSLLPQATLSAITAAVVDLCDTLDGVADGIIENPLKCKFDIESLACRSDSTATSCLTTAQIEAVKLVYGGPKDSRTGATLYPGFSTGSESEWILQERILANAFSIPILQNLVFDNLSYDASTFNWGSDVVVSDIRAGKLIDEISPDISAFQKNGGKMLVTQGWTDPFNAATWPIEHLDQIQNFFGGDVSDFFSLFMIPGGGHCGAAPTHPSVPSEYATVEAITSWVEKGHKPKAIMSSNPPDRSSRTRKLCSWPQTAVFVGDDQNDWTSYECRVVA